LAAVIHKLVQAATQPAKNWWRIAAWKHRSRAGEVQRTVCAKCERDVELQVDLPQFEKGIRFGSRY